MPSKAACWIGWPTPFLIRASNSPKSPAYNLFQVYANVQAGQRFAEKTKQKLEREQGRNPPTYLLVCTQTACGFYGTKSLLYLLLDLREDEAQDPQAPAQDARSTGLT